MLAAKPDNLTFIPRTRVVQRKLSFDTPIYHKLKLHDTQGYIAMMFLGLSYSTMPTTFQTWSIKSHPKSKVEDTDNSQKTLLPKERNEAN